MAAPEFVPLTVAETELLKLLSRASEMFAQTAPLDSELKAFLRGVAALQALVINGEPPPADEGARHDVRFTTMTKGGPVPEHRHCHLCGDVDGGHDYRCSLPGCPLKREPQQQQFKTTPIVVDGLDTLTLRGGETFTFTSVLWPPSERRSPDEYDGWRT